MSVVGAGVCAVLLAGCNSEPAGSQNSPLATPGKTLEVYVTNYPLQYLASTIAGNAANVHFPVPKDVDPALWKPSEDEIKKMQEADLILINGAGYEQWIEHVSLPETKVVNTSENVKRKNRYIKLDEAIVHKHGPDGEHAHEGYASYTWLDPQIMDMQCYMIREALIERRPDVQGLLEANAGTISQSFVVGMVLRLRALELKFPEFKIIGSHPIYQYLARYLNWSLKSVDWEPTETPSDEQWEKFAALLAKHPATVMLWEAEPTPETRKRLEEEFNLKVVVFDPLVHAPESGDYLKAMQANIGRLEEALGVEPQATPAPAMPGGALPAPGAAPPS